MKNHNKRFLRLHFFLYTMQKCIYIRRYNCLKLKIKHLMNEHILDFSRLLFLMIICYTGSVIDHPKCLVFIKMKYEKKKSSYYLHITTSLIFQQKYITLNIFHHELNSFEEIRLNFHTFIYTHIICEKKLKINHQIFCSIRIAS